jgi:alpha-ketoglutarate-dependent taurine dioxygenase
MRNEDEERRREMSTIAIKRLTENVGAEIDGVDVDRLLNDDELPGELMAALEQHGALVFPQLNLDPQTQVAICQRLGAVDFSQGQAVPGIMVVSLDETKTPSADYLRGTFEWHMDGVTLTEGRDPQKATLISAVALADDGGQTSFASTYGAYESLSAEEKQRYGNLRVRHSVASIVRRVTPNPTPEQEESWARSPGREHPLVWRHRTGRKSLVMGSTADSIVGMDLDEGRALLDELLERSTKPDRVYRHEWSVGDTVLWDNRGVLHRVDPYAIDSQREMIRTTFLGDEPIQ